MHLISVKCNDSSDVHSFGIHVIIHTLNVSCQSWIQRTDTEYIVKCVERVLSYNLQHTVDPAQSLREPLLCVCVCVSMGPTTAGTYYLLRSAVWSRSRQLLSNHCPLPCHPATPLRHILSQAQFGGSKGRPVQLPSPNTLRKLF